MEAPEGEPHSGAAAEGKPPSWILFHRGGAAPLAAQPTFPAQEEAATAGQEAAGSAARPGWGGAEHSDQPLALPGRAAHNSFPAAKERWGTH